MRRKPRGGEASTAAHPAHAMMTGADMSNASDNPMTLADFERLLDVYGSDRSRWPVPARASAGQLVARDRAARRLLAQAESLDRVLERAPLPSLAREAALAERIVVLAHRTPRMVATRLAHRAAPHSPGRSDAGDSGAPLSAGAPRLLRWPKTELGSVAGALAASLLLGVFIGLSSLSQNVPPALEQLTGIALTTPVVVGQLDLGDEDLL